VPDAPNSQNGSQSTTGSAQAQSSSTTTAGGDGSGNGNANGNRGERDIFNLVDLMRMRRVWYQHNNRFGDFGPLDAALIDLAHALGDNLSDEEINRLPTSVYCSSNAGTSSTCNHTCTICMDDFVDDEVQRHLPCSHTFHKTCVDQWLKQKCTCPICRVDARGSTRSS